MHRQLEALHDYKATKRWQIQAVPSYIIYAHAATKQKHKESDQPLNMFTHLIICTQHVEL